MNRAQESKWKAGKQGYTYIRPSNQIVGRFFQALNQGMRYDFIGKVESTRELDKLETGFAATRIATDHNVRFEIGGYTICAIARLFSDGFEEKVHTVNEPLAAAWTGG